MARRLVLISTSTVFGTRYLEHAYPELRDAFGGASRVLFIPHAIQDRDGYVAKARPAFEEMGYGLDSLHEAFDPAAGDRECRGHLLRRRQHVPPPEGARRDGRAPADSTAGDRGHGLLGGERRARTSPARRSAPRTTCRSCSPPPSTPSFLVRFQINPHYLDPAPGSTHMGETRETRIREFHEENEAPVVGLREGAILRVEGDSVLLKGVAGARIFRRGLEPVEVSPVAEIGPLLGVTPRVLGFRLRSAAAPLRSSRQQDGSSHDSRVRCSRTRARTRLPWRVPTHGNGPGGHARRSQPRRRARLDHGCGDSAASRRSRLARERFDPGESRRLDPGEPADPVASRLPASHSEQRRGGWRWRVASRIKVPHGELAALCARHGVRRLAFSARSCATTSAPRATSISSWSSSRARG